MIGSYGGGCCVRSIAVFWFLVSGASSMSTFTPLVTIPCNHDSRCALGSFNTTMSDVDVLYEASNDTINGTLRQDVILDTNGTCVKMAYIFLGNDNIQEKKEERIYYPIRDIREKLEPGFGSQSRCQWFDAALRLYHLSCQTRTYDANSILAGQTVPQCKVEHFRTPKKRRVLNHDPNCLHLLGGIKINPVIVWLEMKMKDKSYPVVSMKQNTVHIDWGQAIKFGCDDPNVNTNGKIKYKIFHSKISLVEDTKDLNGFNPATIKFTNNDWKGSLKDVRCVDWNVVIEAELGFNLNRDKKGKSWQTQHFKFETTVERKKYNVNVTATKNTTMITIQTQQGTNVECLSNTVDIEVIRKDQGKLKSRNAPFETANINFVGNLGYVDLAKFNNEKCKNTFLTVSVKDITEKAVFTDIYCEYPVVERLSMKNNGRLVVTPPHFQECPNLYYDIECEHQNKIVTNKTVCSNCSFEIPNIGKNDVCKAKAYLNENKDNAVCGPKWVYIIGDKPSVNTMFILKQENISTYILAGLGGLVVLVIAFIIIGNQKKKRLVTNLKTIRTLRKGKLKEKEMSKEVTRFVINKKDDNISEKLNYMVNSQVGEIVAEFESIQTFVSLNLDLKTNISMLEENRLRNRYIDVLPYDSNIVTLKAKRGNPPSSYINASKIEFPGISQKFLTVQAPKINMFSSYWQMIEDQNVRLIVMITALEEMGRVKADRYWPDANNSVLEFDGGLSVRFFKETKEDTFCHRHFVLRNGKGMERKIQQLQTEEWKDKAAPRSTKVLLDLIDKSEQLIRPVSSPVAPPPLLVHCSAGVGRTGTYIGLFKLINDFDNDDVEELDFFQTVLAMREQRMKMVQKPLQYHYMIKCLADYVASNEKQQKID